MREFLFRGQTRRHGEKVRMNGEKIPGRWVYGGVLQGSGDHSIIYGGENADDPGEGLDKWTVYTDTLGQYTGLKDKNGKRIFEGDILLLDREDGYFKLEFDEDTARFVMIGDYVQVDFDNFWSYEVEVIGNIHDNPGLLEVGAHE